MPKRRANGEGSITKRPDGLWMAQFTDHNGKRKSLYGKTQQIVKDKLKEAIRQSDLGIEVDKGKIKLVDWLEQWLEVYIKPNVRRSTYGTNYKHLIKHIAPAFPNIVLKDLRADMLQKFFNEKAVNGKIKKVKNPETGELETEPGGICARTLSHMLSTLRHALRQAVDNGIIAQNVADKVKLPKVGRSEIRILTVEEQKALQKSAMEFNNPLAIGIVIALFTGLRVGELLALQKGDIDFGNKLLRVRRSIGRPWIADDPEGAARVVVNEPKTEKGKRIIPLPDFALPVFRQLVNQRERLVSDTGGIWMKQGKPVHGSKWVDEGYLFLTLAGTVIDHSRFNKMFHKVLDEAGLPSIHFHALRHPYVKHGLKIIC